MKCKFNKKNLLLAVEYGDEANEGKKVSTDSNILSAGQFDVYPSLVPTYFKWE